MTEFILDGVNTIVGVFGKLYQTFQTPMGELLPIANDIFPENLTLFGVMFGGGVITFIVYTIVKWILDIVL